MFVANKDQSVGTSLHILPSEVYAL